MREILDEIYNRSSIDDWSGELIRDETAKVHETIRVAITSFTAVILSPTTSDYDKKWARASLDRVMGSDDD